MISVDLAWPFSLGMVAAFNPCGFAMLPVYVSFFLGGDSDDDASTPRSMARALKVGAALTAGFVVLFGAVGIVTSTILSQGDILSYTPYVTFVLGLLLVPLGIAMIGGYELKVSTPRLERGGDSGQMWSMFLFGVSYAVVSLGCTVGIFISAVSSSFTADGFVDGVLVFISYALGMGAVILTLTLALALARTSIATNMRRILPWVNRISGVLLVLSGIYLAIYGWWEIQVLDDPTATNSVVSFFEDIQPNIVTWINETGATRLGVGLLLIVAAALTRVMWADMSQQGRALALGGLGVAWILAEFVWQRANLFILPTVRTIVGFPGRIGNWFTDPWRWGVIGEILVLGILAASIWFRLRGRQTRSPHPATT